MDAARAEARSACRFVLWPDEHLKALRPARDRAAWPVIRFALTSVSHHEFRPSEIRTGLAHLKTEFFGAWAAAGGSLDMQRTAFRARNRSFPA
jgi:hypothetical protein